MGWRREAGLELGGGGEGDAVTRQSMQSVEESVGSDDTLCTL